MARINIEDKLYRDIRFLKLSEKIGRRQALGELVELWFLSQEYWKKGELIPIEVFEIHEFNQAIIDFRLAKVEPNGIYVCGSDEQFAWLEQRIKAAKKGGQANKDRLERINNNLGKPDASQTKPAVSPQPQPQPQNTILESSSASPNIDQPPKSKKKNKSFDPELLEASKRVVGFLNELCDKNYRYNNKKTLTLIKNILSEGYTEDDMMKVIAIKDKEWFGKTSADGREMGTYLRPTTLFAASHFDDYLNQEKKDD